MVHCKQYTQSQKQGHHIKVFLWNQPIGDHGTLRVSNVIPILFCPTDAIAAATPAMWSVSVYKHKEKLQNCIISAMKTQYHSIYIIKLTFF